MSVNGSGGGGGGEDSIPDRPFPSPMLVGGVALAYYAYKKGWI